MARPGRMESEAGVYLVLNRGNYRSDIFKAEGAKAAFEARERTGSRTDGVWPLDAVAWLA